MRLAQLFQKWVEETNDYEIMAPVYFGTVCFRAHPNNLKDEGELNLLNEKLLNSANATGKVFMSHTKLDGKFTIRMVISSLRVEEKHVELAWNIIRKSLKEISN